MAIPWQFVRFLCVGALNTGVGYLLFVAFTLAGAGPALALAEATVLGVAFNFQTYMRLVFRAGHGRVAPFLAVYFVGFILNWAALKAMVHVGVRPFIAQAALALPLALLTYLGQRRFVFGRTL